MKKLLFIFALAFATPLIVTSCKTSPSTQNVEVQSLKATGQSAEAAVELSAQLYRDHKITDAQARQVMDFFNNRFEPAYNLAVAAAKSDLSSVASPDLMNLAIQLSALVVSFQTK